jgi:hypothetical protein
MDHVVRLIFTVLFLMGAVSGLFTGQWAGAVVSLLIAYAIGHKFYVNGKIKLNYNEIVV